jgi:hypothetical protein
MPTADAQSSGNTGATPSPTNSAVGTVREHRAGYATTREMWRYCPRDGSHPCVDLDIPGVTSPEAKTAQ